VGASKAATPAKASPAVGGNEADKAVRRLEEMAADVRGCALLNGDGNVLAASGDTEARDDWADAAEGLFAAADAVREEPAQQIHVGTEEGEVFAVRHGGLAMIAVSDRFTLGSLLFSDMRVVLRDLARGAA
jgi:predicted regulator of Ras-like GTPase activity (Roadblock/LC7/MglB family)